MWIRTAERHLAVARSDSLMSVHFLPCTTILRLIVHSQVLEFFVSEFLNSSFNIPYDIDLYKECSMWQLLNKCGRSNGVFYIQLCISLCVCSYLYAKRPISCVIFCCALLQFVDDLRIFWMKELAGKKILGTSKFCDLKQLAAFENIRNWGENALKSWIYC